MMHPFRQPAIRVRVRARARVRVRTRTRGRVGVDSGETGALLRDRLRVEVGARVRRSLRVWG